jgi:outer membrane lipoprotein SlyB
MKITQEDINMAKYLAEQNGDYCYNGYGIRVQDKPFALGTIDHVSNKWVDGEDTKEQLGGICVTELDGISASRCGEYDGKYMALVGGDYVGAGEDDSEAILTNASVIAVLH